MNSKDSPPSPSPGPAAIHPASVAGNTVGAAPGDTANSRAVPGLEAAEARAAIAARRAAREEARIADLRKQIIAHWESGTPWPLRQPKGRGRPTPYLASNSATTSVKLGAETRTRLYALADWRGRSPHALLKEAVLVYLDRAEAIEWYRRVEAAAAADDATASEADEAAGEADGAPSEAASGAATVEAEAAPRDETAAESLAGFVHSRLVPGSVIPDAVAKMILDGTHRLRALRGWRGFSIGRVMAMLAAQGIDLREGELASIEAGLRQPQPRLIVALARVLAVTVEDLTG